MQELNNVQILMNYSSWHPSLWPMFTDKTNSTGAGKRHVPTFWETNTACTFLIVRVTWVMYNFNEYFSPSFLISLQVGNLGLLFMLLFFIFAALGVELFGDLGKFSALPAL